jgi:hypothetical protein
MSARKSIRTDFGRKIAQSGAVGQTLSTSGTIGVIGAADRNEPAGRHAVEEKL